MEIAIKVEVEKRRRIRLSIFAYAYEIEHDSLISDSAYDKLSLAIDPSISTGNKKLDTFFKEHFDPNTGMWIYRHPEIHKIAHLYKILTTMYSTDKWHSNA